jgi:hypothetical protein
MGPPSQQRTKSPERPSVNQARGGIVVPGAVPVFQGFPEFRSNVLYCPKQFFTVVVPHSSVNCIRVVSYMLRKTLGWVDETGEPIEERHAFSYRELEQAAGVSHSRLAEALEEASGGRFIRRTQKARVQTQGVRAQSAAYELCWDEHQYTDEPSSFRGFFLQPTYIDQAGQTRLGRKNIPNIFYDYLVRNENRGLIRVVGTLLWYSIDWGKGGERRQPMKKSLRELVELTKLDKSSVVRALDEAENRGYVERIERGVFDLSGTKQSSVTVYGIHWTNGYTYTYEGLPVAVGSEGERSQNATRGQLANAPKMQHGEQPGTLPKCDTESAPERSQNATCNAPKMQRRERSQNATIRITKTDITNTSIFNSSSAAITEPSVVAAHTALNALLKAGFAEPVAKRLLQQTSAEVVLRQVEFFPEAVSNQKPTGATQKSDRRELARTGRGKTTDVRSFGCGTAGSSFCGALLRWLPSESGRAGVAAIGL